MAPGCFIKGVEEFYLLVEEKFNCILCSSSVKSRDTFITHLKHAHPDVHQKLSNPIKPVTSADEFILQDFRRIVGALDVQLEARDIFLFNYNKQRKYMNFAYAIIDKEALKPVSLGKRKREGELSRSICTVDPYVNTKYQINPLKAKLPKGYQLGHLIAYRNHAITDDLYDLMHQRTLIAPQHAYLNQFLWEKLENASLLLNVKYEVRVLNGTSGSLSHDELKETTDEGSIAACSVQIPKYWYSIILAYDKFSNIYHYDAYCVPNIESNLTLEQCRVTLAAVRNETHFQFFSNVPYTPVRTNLVREADYLHYELRGTVESLKDKVRELEEENEGLRAALH